MTKHFVPKIILFFLVLFWQQMLLAAPLQILQANVSKTTDGITICDFTLNRAPLYQAFGLSNPPRIVIDFDNANMLGHINRTELANTPLKNIRIGKHENNSLRVVLDTNRALGFHISTSKNHNANRAHLIIAINAGKETGLTNNNSKQVKNLNKAKVTKKNISKKTLRTKAEAIATPSTTSTPIPEVAHEFDTSLSKKAAAMFMATDVITAKNNANKAKDKKDKQVTEVSLPIPIPPKVLPKETTSKATPQKDVAKSSLVAETEKLVAGTEKVAAEQNNTPVVKKPTVSAAPVPATSIKPAAAAVAAASSSAVATTPLSSSSSSPTKSRPATRTAAAQPPVVVDPKASVTLIESDDKRQPRDIVVVIDPGHGGKDPGAHGPKDTKEKDVVLVIAKNLQNYLNNQNGYSAILTRDSDYYINLHERLRIAHVNKADIFLSLHADAYKSSIIKGTTLFALAPAGATSEAAHWLAEKENISELDGQVKTSDNLRSILFGLAQKASVKSSLLAGNAILSSLTTVDKLHTTRIEQADFVVLHSPDIPSLLIEVGYISDPLDEQKLQDPLFQEMFARAVARGIMNYFTQHPLKGTIAGASARKHLFGSLYGNSNSPLGSQQLASF